MCRLCEGCGLKQGSFGLETGGKKRRWCAGCASKPAGAVVSARSGKRPRPAAVKGSLPSTFPSVTPQGPYLERMRAAGRVGGPEVDVSDTAARGDVADWCREAEAATSKGHVIAILQKIAEGGTFATADVEGVSTCENCGLRDATWGIPAASKDQNAQWCATCGPGHPGAEAVTVAPNTPPRQGGAKRPAGATAGATQPPRTSPRLEEKRAAGATQPPKSSQTTSKTALAPSSATLSMLIRQEKIFGRDLQKAFTQWESCAIAHASLLMDYEDPSSVSVHRLARPIAFWPELTCGPARAGHPRWAAKDSARKRSLAFGENRPQGADHRGEVGWLLCTVEQGRTHTEPCEELSMDTFQHTAER